jgi:hypothetical protein
MAVGPGVRVIEESPIRSMRSFGWAPWATRSPAQINFRSTFGHFAFTVQRSRSHHRLGSGLGRALFRTSNTWLPRSLPGLSPSLFTQCDLTQRYLDYPQTYPQLSVLCVPVTRRCAAPPARGRPAGSPSEPGGRRQHRAALSVTTGFGRAHEGSDTVPSGGSACPSPKAVAGPDTLTAR